jgi:hypothetical protein
LKLDVSGGLVTWIYKKRDGFHLSILRFPHLCSNIPSFFLRITADSICKGLFDIPSFLISKQSTDMPVDFTGLLQFRF